MNENHSEPEWFCPRWATAPLACALQQHPVTVITGARQVGKTTLLRYAEPTRDWRYLTLDDLDVLRQAETDPAALWAGTERLAIDEVQRVPLVINALKQAVDEEPGRRRFVLSGSANLLLMQRVSESLAGRAVYWTLLPMTLGEMTRSPAPDLLERLLRSDFSSIPSAGAESADPLELAVRGFMPALMSLGDHAAVLRWWEGYVATYLERDLRQISQVSSLSDYRQVMMALALRTGQLLNQTEVARDTAVSQASVSRYLNLLEATCVAERVHAFARNRTKRLLKSPKLYWVDPGLAAFLCGLHDSGALRQSRESGSIFENLVLLHLRALAQMLVPRAEIYYWSTVTGTEVDFVLEWGRQLVAVEVKLTERPGFGDCAGLKVFLDEYPEASCGVLVHAGKTAAMMAERIVALPWQGLAIGSGLGQ